MNCNLRVASSVDDIKSTDHVFQVVNQADLQSKNSNTSENLKVLGNNTLGTLNINILDEVANRIIAGKDKRTIAHELGHSAGLPHMGLLEDMNNLMIQSWRIQDAGKDPSKATFLNNGQINLMMHNYINGKINKVSPVRSFLFKKILTK